MLRISATLLDSFRLLKEADFMTPDEFDARIRRDPIEPSRAMQLGTAFHAIAEGLAWKGIGESNEEVYEHDGFLFDAESSDEALKHLVGGVSEAKQEVVINSPFGPIAIVGKADYLRGVTADEIKTKDKEFDLMNYADAWQWRTYCRVFGVQRVIYHLCRLEQDEETGVWLVRSHEMLPLYAYPGVNADVEAAALDLAKYSADLGLLNYLRQSSEKKSA